MSLGQRLVQLRQHLAELRVRFEGLGQKLVSEGERVGNQGCPPDQLLCPELTEATRAFQAAAKELELLQRSLPGSAAVSEWRSLGDLEAACRLLEAHVGPEKDTMVESPRRAVVPGEWLPDLICALVRDKRLGPAYWLARYQEIKHGTVPLPPLLIKALELAEVVEGDGGPAARWLSSIYAHRDFEVLLAAPSDQAEAPAFAMLAFAALLRPSLVAPGTGAPQLLAKLNNLPPGLSELCTVLTGGFENGSWEEQARAIAAEAAGWRQRNRKLTTAAVPAARLWEAMCGEGGLVQQLLRAVWENEHRAAGEVRELALRLRNESDLRREVREFYRRNAQLDAGQDVFHVPGSWQVLARMREALALAERWLKIQEQLARSRAEADNLSRMKRSGLLKRVAGELDALVRGSPGDRLVAAAAVLCRGCLDSLDDLLGQGRQAAPDPDELASREVAKQPELKLEPLWMPSAEAVERLGSALLVLFDDPWGTGTGDDHDGTAPPAVAAFAEATDSDRFWNDDTLTPQEMAFIRETFFAGLGKGAPKPGDEQGAPERRVILASADQRHRDDSAP